MKRAFGGAAIVAALTVVVAGSAATLPGGTSIDAAIVSHTNGQIVPAGPGTVTAQGSIGTGPAVANTALIYIVDISGSTSESTGGSNCPNQNVYDDTANTTLDCELLAIRNLNTAAIATGTVAQIGMIGFGGDQSLDDNPNAIVSAFPLDLDNANGTQSLIAPGLNNFSGPGVPVYQPENNLEWALQGAYNPNLPGSPLDWPARIDPTNAGFARFSQHEVIAGTNYGAALIALRNLIHGLNAIASAVTRIQAVIVSDGAANAGVSGFTMQTLLSQIDPPPGRTLVIDTFAVGANGTCGLVAGTSEGTLAQIAARYGRTCVRLNNPQDAVTAVPGVIASKLANTAIRVDGAVTSFTIRPAVTGPASVSRSVDVSNLGAGDHELCASASGTDGGGFGSTGFNCITVTAKNPPVISGGGDDPATGFVGTVAEGSRFGLSTSVSDATTQSWSAAGGTGTCTFADPSAASTSVTCTDDGVYTLTLRATDNATPAQTTRLVSHLNVTNVAPDATMTVAPASVPLSAASVHARVGIADPGADAWSCTFDWGDGSTTSTPPSSVATCDADHTYTAPGSYSVRVHVVDGDGGSDDDLGTADVKAPPALTGLPADGTGGAPGGTVAEGSPFTITGSVTGASSLQWTGGGGRCTFAADAVPTSVRCDDNGTYELTLTAVDAFGQTSTSSFHLLVTNVAPTLLVTSPGAGASPRTATFTGNVFDPGTADTHTRTINWGDGSPVQTVAAVGGTCSATHTYPSSVSSTMIVATAADDDGAVSDAVMRALSFNRPPVCSAVDANVDRLWPANHKLVLVTVSGATDPDGDAVTYLITGVQQDEALNGLGDGDTSPDAQLASGARVYLRAERSGNGDGRVYTVSVKASDPSGASCMGTVRVAVPHSQNEPAVKTPAVSVNSLG